MTSLMYEMIHYTSSSRPFPGIKRQSLFYDGVDVNVNLSLYITYEISETEYIWGFSTYLTSSYLRSYVSTNR